VNSVGLAWFDPEIAVSYRFACMRDGAALKQLLESGEVNKHESVVLFNTGSGVKYMEAFTADDTD